MVASPMDTVSSPSMVASPRDTPPGGPGGEDPRQGAGSQVLRIKQFRRRFSAWITSAWSVTHERKAAACAFAHSTAAIFGVFCPANAQTLAAHARSWLQKFLARRSEE